MSLSIKRTFAFILLFFICAIWLTGCNEVRLPTWLTPPSLVDLQPKFNALQPAMTPEAAEAVMGSAKARYESTTAGVSHLTLTWADFNASYSARFLAGRLYTKTQGPLISSDKG